MWDVELAICRPIMPSDCNFYWPERVFSDETGTCVLESELCGEDSVYAPTATGECKSKSENACVEPLKWNADDNECSVRDQTECEEDGLVWNAEADTPACESAADRR